MARHSDMMEPSSRPIGKVSMRRGRPNRDEAVAMERAIIESALELFRTKGLDGVSMDGLSRAVGITRTTLYSRYPTKGRLFQAVVRHSIANWYARPGVTTDRGTAEIQQILHGHVAAIASLLIDPDFVTIHQLLLHNRNRFPELAVTMHEFGFVNAVELLAGDITWTAERDGIPASNPKAIAEHIITSIHGWYLQYGMVRELSRDEIEAHGRSVVDLLVGIRPNW